MRIHPLPVRITHWTNAVAMTVMIASGWQIYNASPLFAFTFPAWLTLGGHIGRRLFPLRPHDVWRDATQALHFRLPHDSTHYNAVQRLLYVLAGCGIALAIVSGLAIWKPVQLYPLTFLLGGYELRAVSTSSPCPASSRSLWCTLHWSQSCHRCCDQW